MASLRALGVSTRRRWIDHLWADLCLAAVVVLTHLLLVLIAPSADILGNSLPTDRRGVYTSAAVVVSLLGSLSAVAIGQLGSASGSRAKTLRDQGAVPLARNWRSVFRAALLAAVIALLALLLDPSVHTDSALPVVIRWVFEASVVFAIVKFFRLSALFYEVLTVAALSESDDDREDEVLADAPTVDPSWHERMSA